ncbi:MAG: GNAT family N-acetyltransferase [Caulobacteraceae bacterium]
MDIVAVRELFDRTLRADRRAVVGIERVWVAGVLRTTQGGHNFIGCWDFLPDRMEAIVAREVAHLHSVGGDLLWQVYDHDRPAGLERVLADAGFEDQGMEKLLALEASAAASLERPPGVDFRQVRTEEDLASYAAVLRNAFGDQEWATIDFYLPRLSDPAMVLYLAYVDGEAVATGRLEAPRDGLFAGLNDGGVIPQYRGTGLFRAIVAERAAEAARRGARYLLVNAWETSRPTLERLGFELLATRRQWKLKAPLPK